METNEEIDCAKEPGKLPERVFELFVESRVLKRDVKTHSFPVLDDSYFQFKSASQ